ncbi:MAG: hypothetical protein HQL70_08145 [Magnetococcales bacterium]|nr:hypothetical protein [Magnetococcales bacterium]
MSILLIIDGLVMEGDPSPGAYCHDLNRMAAVGHCGSVDFGPGSAFPEQGNVYSDILLGVDVWGVNKTLPLGFISAYGMGLDPDLSRTWAALGLLHLFPKANKLLFLSPYRVGLSSREKKQLILGLQEEFNHQGWTVHWSDEWGAAVVSVDDDLDVVSSPLDVLEGQSFFDCLPQGSDANNLLSLVTTGQMLLAREPLNKEREKKRLLPLNTPWLWGVARGGDQMENMLSVAESGTLWSSDSVVAGLGRLAGFVSSFLDEKNGLDVSELKKITQCGVDGNAVIHFKTPAMLARLGLLPERQARLEQIDKQFIAPLAKEMAGLGGKMVVVTPVALDKEGLPVVGSVPWVSAQDRELTAKKRFWQRKAMGSGEPIEVKLFRSEWYS